MMERLHLQFVEDFLDFGSLCQIFVQVEKILKLEFVQ